MIKKFEIGQLVLFPTDHKALGKYTNEIVIGFKAGVISSFEEDTTTGLVTAKVKPMRTIEDGGHGYMEIENGTQVEFPVSMLIQIGVTATHPLFDMMEYTVEIHNQTRNNKIVNHTFEEVVIGEDRKINNGGLRRKIGGANL